jgi:hypothetical protein
MALRVVDFGGTTSTLVWVHGCACCQVLLIHRFTVVAWGHFLAVATVPWIPLMPHSLSTRSLCALLVCRHRALLVCVLQCGSRCPHLHLPGCLAAGGPGGGAGLGLGPARGGAGHSAAGLEPQQAAGQVGGRMDGTLAACGRSTAEAGWLVACPPPSLSSHLSWRPPVLHATPPLCCCLHSRHHAGGTACPPAAAAAASPWQATRCTQ